MHGSPPQTNSYEYVNKFGHKLKSYRKVNHLFHCEIYLMFSLYTTVSGSIRNRKGGGRGKYGVAGGKVGGGGDGENGVWMGGEGKGGNRDTLGIYYPSQFL